MEGFFAFFMIAACVLFWGALIVSAVRWIWAAGVLAVILSTIGFVVLGFIVHQLITFISNSKKRKK